MMTKNRSGKVAMLKPLFALPAVILLVLAFSLSGSNTALSQEKNTTTVISDVPAPPKDVAPADLAIGSAQKEEVFIEVPVPPEYKGGMDALVQYIVSEVKYPAEAKKKGITGKVLVSFVVDKKGNIKDAKIMKSLDSLLDAEALRVVSKMPAWNPGRDDKGNPVNVSMILPIAFSLDGKKLKTEEK